MKHEYCDVLVIGGGPGGISAASKLALKGKKCIIINDGLLMGYGIQGAFRTKAAYEITSEHLHIRYLENVYGKVLTLDFTKLQHGIEESSDQLSAMLESRLNRLQVKVVQGRTSFCEAKRVRVGADEYSGEKIIIATGTRPRILPGMPLDSPKVITSDEAIALTHTPKSILILVPASSAVSLQACSTPWGPRCISLTRVNISWAMKTLTSAVFWRMLLKPEISM